MAMFKKISASAALMAAAAVPAVAVATATSADASQANAAQHAVMQSDVQHMHDIWPI